MFERNLSSSSVKRIFSSIKAIINLAIKENGLNRSNPFAKTYTRKEASPVERPPIPICDIRLLQAECYEIDDENRWLVAIIADTRMRLAEAIDLKSENLVLDVDQPYVRVVRHPWQSLKTSSSTRELPLVGSALWAAYQIKKTKTEFAFPKYCNASQCSLNSANAAINKWLRPSIPKRCVIHSFRHSLRDPLRDVECPSDIVYALGGWGDCWSGAEERPRL